MSIPHYEDFEPEAYLAPVAWMNTVTTPTGNYVEIWTNEARATVQIQEWSDNGDLDAKTTPLYTHSSVEGEEAREALERGSIEVGITVSGDVAVWEVVEGQAEGSPSAIGDEIIPTILAALASQAPAQREEKP